MAEKQPQQEVKKDKKPSKEAKPVVKKQEEELSEVLIRVFGYDIPGSRSVYAGLTRIKGISWTLSNTVCIKLNIPRNKRFRDLSKDEIKNIETYIKNIEIPDYQKNRRKDPETGVTTHLLGTDLDITREFDIKRLKKIKSYKGVRHQYRLPVRGQRTRSHFRTQGAGAKVRRKKAA